MDKFLSEMGERIRKRRLQLNWSQDDLSNHSDVSPQVISTAELGKKGLRPSNIVKLSNALNVSTDYILTGNIEMRDLTQLEEKIIQLNQDQLISIESIIDNYLKK